MGSGTDFKLGFKSTANNAAGNENAGALTSNSNAPGSAGGGGGGTGTVTSVATGNGLTGGPITTSGTIKMAVGSTVGQVWRWLTGGWTASTNGYVYPEDYGAVGDGSTDDSVAIQAAVTACPASFALFLSKNYGIGTGNGAAGITVSACAIASTGGAKFTSVGGQANGITIQGCANYRFQLPDLQGFSGYGVRFQNNGNTSCGPNWFECQHIDTCGIGVDFYTSGTGSGSALDISGRVVWFTTCTTANRLFFGGVSAGLNQGNNVDSNFVLNCNSWVRFDIGAGVTNPYINDNTFTCDAFDAGGIGSVKAINNTTGLGCNQNKFICRTFWGGFNAGDYWIYSPGGNALDYCDYDFGAGSGLVGTTAQQYAMVSNAEYKYGWGSAYRLGFGAKMPNNAGIALATSANSRSSWNSGNAVQYNRILVTLQLSSLASGSTATFYAYHPFAQGNARLRWENDPVSGSMAGCMIDSMVDNYGTNPNEIAIVVRNVSGATSSANLVGTLCVGIP